MEELCQSVYPIYTSAWLATGKLYSIVAGHSESRNMLAVIGTYTGMILLNGICDYDTYPPADQSWLSTFDTPEHFPITIVFETSTTCTKASLGSIIGRRRF